MFNCQVAHQNCVYACPTPIQEAVARAFELELKRLESPECYFKSISVDLQQRRDMIVSILEEAGIPPVVPEVKKLTNFMYFSCLSKFVMIFQSMLMLTPSYFSYNLECSGCLQPNYDLYEISNHKIPMN